MRQLTAVDARTMADIHEKSFERSWDALEMAAHIQKDICFGIEADGALVAFIILASAAGQAEILTIATHPLARQQGLGQQLLAGTMHALQQSETTELFLEVAEDNAAAIALYRRSGFTPIGRRPGYYRRAGGRIAALTFSKKL